MTTVATASLTERSASALAAAIRAGEASSRNVVEAHIEVFERAQLNALVADRFDEARADADAADARVAEAREAGSLDDLPPLHGVPCTVKESISLKGMPNSAGLVVRSEHLAETTAPAAQRLLDAGVIPLGVTNVSELTMWIESDNRVYGRTHNAYDRKRIAGGSSGGEGAAVGSGGSPIGLGSDIAGSIRIPAFFNGVFGHKSSSNLVPNTDMFPRTHGEAGRMLAVGPLSRRAEDLMPVLRAISGPDGRDEQVREVDLGDPAEVEFAGLDVVISEHASLLPVRRELREARERAAGALAGAGANVRRESMKSLRRALELFLMSLQDGAGITTREILEAEGADPVGWRTAFKRGGPHTPATLLLLFSESVASRMPDGRMQRLRAAAKSLREEVEGVVGGGILLHPPHPRVAPRHRTTIGQSWLLTPTAVFNLVGLPATAVPMGLNARGLPLGVQVVAGYDRDHMSIAAAIELERVFGGWVPPHRA